MSFDSIGTTRYTKTSYSSYRTSFVKTIPYEYALGKQNPYTGEEVKTRDDYEAYCFSHYLKDMAEEELVDLRHHQNAYQSEANFFKDRASNLLKSRDFFIYISLILLIICFITCFICTNQVKKIDELQLSISTLEKENEIFQQSLSNTKESLKEDIGYIDYDNTFVPEDYRKGYNDAICGNKPAPEYVQCYNCTYWNPDYSDYIHFFEVSSIWIPLCESCLDSDDAINIMGEDYCFNPVPYP